MLPVLFLVVCAAVAHVFATAAREQQHGIPTPAAKPAVDNRTGEVHGRRRQDGQQPVTGRRMPRAQISRGSRHRQRRRWLTITGLFRVWRHISGRNNSICYRRRVVR